MMRQNGLKIEPLPIIIMIIFVSYCNGEATKRADHDVVKRQAANTPTTPCNSSNEGQSLYTAVHAGMIWICRSDEWIPYKLSPSIGSTKSMSGRSCKHLKQQLTTDCNAAVTSGLYWVKGTQTCPESQNELEPIMVYCDMSELDGGGWTLVWQHSYMEDLPLSPSMRYFSEDYTPCVTRASGWCNIPNKARFNATEQMIVAYHKGTVVYAYKGVFNENMDDNWSGAILLDFKEIIDQCTDANGVQPAPENALIIGLTFDKVSPYNHVGANCDTYRGSLTSPGDCRWENCKLPSSISSSNSRVQMTMAIYVR